MLIKYLLFGCRNSSSINIEKNYPPIIISNRKIENHITRSLFFEKVIISSISININSTPSITIKQISYRIQKWIIRTDVNIKTIPDIM